MFYPRRRKPTRLYRRRRPAAARRRLAVSRSIRSNPQPVFTETVSLGSVGMSYSSGTASNTFGGVLKCSMGDITQLGQYETLYQKYRILKAQWTFVPDWTQYDANSSNGITNGLDASFWSSTRMVYAINDSPDQVAPTTEVSVLEDNGCKIRQMNNILRISCVPVPDTLDSNNVQMTFKKKYINFNTTTGNVDHFGVRYFMTCPSYQVGSQAGIVNPPKWTIFLKLTFQLSDPR